MLNLVRLQPGPVATPGCGEPQPARRVLEGYTDTSCRRSSARAGHPAFFGRAAGGYLEQWDVAPDPGWSFGGVIRYRSRRDMMELVTDPALRAGPRLQGRRDGDDASRSPLRPGLRDPRAPRSGSGLLLALLAALGQLALRAVRPRREMATRLRWIALARRARPSRSPPSRPKLCLGALLDAAGLPRALRDPIGPPPPGRLGARPGSRPPRPGAAARTSS